MENVPPVFEMERAPPSDVEVHEVKEGLRRETDEDELRVAKMAPPDCAEQSEKRTFDLSVFSLSIESVPFVPKLT